jgi:cytochrome c-type biogenesis protein CcmE
LLVRTGVVVAILAAAAVAVVDGSFHRSNRVETPSSLLSNRGEWGQQVRLTGVVAPGSLKPSPNGVRFAIAGKSGTSQVVVRYEGDVPNQLRAGEAVAVTGTFGGRTFEAQPSTLVVNCGRTDPQRHC